MVFRNFSVVYRVALKNYRENRKMTSLKYHLDVNEAAITRNNLGQLYEMLKRPEEALQSYKQALRSFQEVEDRRGEAATFMNLGSFWRKRGEPEQAFTCYRQSVRLFQESRDRWGEVRVLRNLAHWYRLSKNFRYALAFLYRSGDMLEELHSPRRQEIEELIALLRHELGQDAFEVLATEVRPEAAQIVEEALRRDMQ